MIGRHLFPSHSLWAAACCFLVCVTSSQITGQSLEEFDAEYLATEGEPDLSDASKLIVQQTNRLRQQQGLNKLESSPKLTDAARYFAGFMATESKYGHQADGNTPADRVSLFDYNYCLVAENIAFHELPRDVDSQELARRLVSGWEESEPHRRNMVDPDLTEIGVAVSFRESNQRYYGVQLFGRPRADAIRVRIANRSAETREYELFGTTDGHSSRKTFQLAPRTARVHVRCRPTSIHWSWESPDEATRLENGQRLTVQAGPDGGPVLEVESGAPQ
jgi:uncharacterized protein YkwD